MEMTSTTAYDNHNKMLIDGYDWLINYFSKHEDVRKVFVNLLMVVIFPAAMAASLMVLVLVICDKKMRSEPWRWLIAHTSLCILVSTFFLFVNGFTSVYHLDSFETSVICPGAKFAEGLFWQMSTVSFILVVIERFRAMGRENWRSGGLGKKAVIASLVFSWIAVIVIHIVNVTVWERAIAYNNVYEEYPGMVLCEIRRTPVTVITDLIILSLLVICALITLSASCIYGCKNSDTDLIRNVINPTVVTIVFYLLLYVACFLLQLIVAEFLDNSVLFDKMYFCLTGMVIAWIVFSLTWIIVWTKNADIGWRKILPCCPGKPAEHIQLVEAK